jgi:hypothetical protein
MLEKMSVRTPHTPCIPWSNCPEPGESRFGQARERHMKLSVRSKRALEITIFRKL